MPVLVRVLLSPWAKNAMLFFPETVIVPLLLMVFPVLTRIPHRPVESPVMLPVIVFVIVLLS